MTMRYEIETPKPARGESQRGGAARGEPRAGERDAHLSATAKSNLREEVRQLKVAEHRMRTGTRGDAQAREAGIGEGAQAREARGAVRRHGGAPGQEVQAERGGTPADHDHDDARDQALAGEGVRPASERRRVRGQLAGVVSTETARGVAHIASEPVPMMVSVCAWLRGCKRGEGGRTSHQLMRPRGGTRRGRERRAHWRGWRCTRPWWPCPL